MQSEMARLSAGTEVSAVKVSVPQVSGQKCWRWTQRGVASAWA